MKETVAQGIRNSPILQGPAAERIVDWYHAGKVHWSRVWTLYVLNKYVELARIARQPERPRETPIESLGTLAEANSRMGTSVG